MQKSKRQLKTKNLKNFPFLISVLIAFLLFFYSLTAVASSGIDYSLPYPGILPDSPFYIFKLMRDNISEFFISNPLKKAEFDIDRADVNIASSVYLAEQKKNLYLIEPTLKRAENYFRKALNNIREAKAQGMDTGGAAKRLVLAKHKYEEVINEIEKKIGEKGGKIESIKMEIEGLGIEEENMAQK